MYIKLPIEVEFIISRLEKSGFQGYIVGGCVRDSLLFKNPQDWDICTDAAPAQVINIFQEICPVIPTGIKHGTVTIILNNSHIEVTTYRIDGTYSDSRHPDNIEFTQSLAMDLARRDFTINAMSYNENTGLVDPFGGLNDLSCKLITCVGNADDRIREDYLRALRAIRFSCQLDFKIHLQTIQAIINNKSLINNISRERIRDELLKILTSPNPGKGFLLLNELELLKLVIPESENYIGLNDDNKRNSPNMLSNISSVLDITPSDLSVRLAALLKCIFEYQSYEIIKISEQILKRLRFDSKTINRISVLLREVDYVIDLSNVDLKRLIARVGPGNIENLFALKIAFIRGFEGTHNDLESVLKLKEQGLKILRENQPLSIRDLKINGHDLLGLGFKPGKEIGIVLDSLLDLVFKNPALNNINSLTGIAKSILK